MVHPRVIYLLLTTLLLAVTARAETIVVPAGGNVQSAVNAMKAGDVVVVTAATAYNVNLTLPNKGSCGPFTIQTSRVTELPVGERVTSAQSSLLAKLQSAVNGEPVIKTVAGACGYKFIGIEVTTATPSVAVFDLVRWGEDRRTQTTVASVPAELSLDRSYVHGWPTQNAQRGVTVNCARCSVANSTIDEIHWIGTDSQAICGWNGTKDLQVVNNYLEAAGENIMIGGADPASVDLLPTNIEIRNNYLFKPLSWKVGDPTYAGIHWTIKNLLEFKNVKTAIVDNNVLENSWGDAQIGYAALFTVRNQDGAAPFSTIENISFTNNWVKNSEQGIQLLGKDNLQPSQRATGLVIRNNRFTGITNRFLTLTGGYANVSMDHNTHDQGGNIMTLAGEPALGFRYTNNVTTRGAAGFGIKGDGTEEGNPTLAKYTPDAVVAGNVIAALGSRVSGYPPNNHYPADLSTVPTLKGTDGLTPGWLPLAVEPTPSPTVPPSPTPTATPVSSPSSTPTPTPVPSPVPSPSPTPTPAPVCSMTTSSLTLSQWSTGKLTVTLSGLSGAPFTVTATGTSGQVWVGPPTVIPLSGTSAIAEFKVQSKKKSGGVVVSGPCGSRTVMVDVR